MYTSHVAVVEFLDALGTWVEESLLKRLRQVSCFSIMVDECTDISTVEKISIYCRWEEDGYYIIEIQVPTTVFQLTLLHLI